MYEDIKHGCVLFRDLVPEEYEYALKFFEASEKQYKRGEMINRLALPLDGFGLVLSGTIQVYMDDMDGNRMIMSTVGPGQTFGESLCFLERESPVSIYSATDSLILQMKTRNMKREKDLPSSMDRMLSNRFTAMLAARTLTMNDRIQILSKLTLREKLITFFSQYTRYGGKKPFSVPFSRQDMAVYLGSDRSALSRELSRMKKEGIIDYQGNTFVIR